MEKSPDAFRTISEVADWLGVPTHVLRFWESRFPQVKPVKRAGGRRYYRPADMSLLGGIKRLLHDDGMTIRGVQKMLREEGVRHVSSFSQPLDAMAPMQDVTPAAEEIPPSPMAVDVEPEPIDNVVAMGAAPPAPEAAEAPPAAAPAEAPLILGAVPRAPVSWPLVPVHGETPDATPPAAGEPDETALAPPADMTEDSLPAETASGSPAPEEAPAHVAAEPTAPAPPVADPQAAPEAEAAEDGPDATPEDEKLPELSFLRRAAPTPDTEPPQRDLFSSRRAVEAPPPPPRRAIPATPDVPETDALDDDAATPAFPGLAARLAVHRMRPDHAAIARAVADLRALRARL
jgi:resuscitation-promoting factor RpfA